MLLATSFLFFLSLHDTFPSGAGSEVASVTSSLMLAGSLSRLAWAASPGGELAAVAAALAAFLPPFLPFFFLFLDGMASNWLRRPRSLLLLHRAPAASRRFVRCTPAARGVPCPPPPRHRFKNRASRRFKRTRFSHGSRLPSLNEALAPHTMQRKALHLRHSSTRKYDSVTVKADCC